MTRGSKYQIFDGAEKGYAWQSPIKNLVLHDKKEFQQESIAPQYLIDEEGLPQQEGQILWGNTDKETPAEKCILVQVDQVAADAFVFWNLELFDFFF